MLHQAVRHGRKQTIVVKLILESNEILIRVNIVTAAACESSTALHLLELLDSAAVTVRLAQCSAEAADNLLLLLLERSP